MAGETKQMDWIIYRTLADGLLVIHLLFIGYIIGGGLLVFHWPRTIWLHLPAVAWGAFVELCGWICPLTPLEIHFRMLSGGIDDQRDFIARILLPVIYPDGLTREIQIGLGLMVAAVNSVIYWCLFRVWRRRRISDNKRSRRSSTTDRI
jgi:uncharacterized membrane protein